MADIEKLEREILERIEADRMPEPDWARTADLPEGWTAAMVSAWVLRSPKSGCEPRPRVVPEVGSSPVGAENRLPAPVVAPQRLVVGPLGHKWMRGVSYERLRRELGDGYYPDDTVNP